MDRLLSANQSGSPGAGRRCRFQRAAFASLLLLLPTAAFADAGTPMMWALAFHLIVGNLLIGIFEGLLVAWLFHLPRLRTVLLAIAANYFSMVVGMTLLYRAWELTLRLFPGDPPLYGAPLRLAVTSVFSWILSIILEWPFYAAAHRNRDHRWRRGLIVSLLAQTASYALLVPYYLFMGNLGIFRETHIQHDLSFVHRPPAAVYYVDSHDESVWRVLTDGSQRTRIGWAPVRGPYEGLTLRPGVAPGTCDLWTEDEQQTPKKRIAAGIPGRGDSGDDAADPFTSKDLRPTGSSLWSVREWFDKGVGAGIEVLNHDKYAYALAADEPFLMWHFSNYTLLPGDDMVFGLWDPGDGKAQVVLINLHSRRAAVLADGWSPVVVEPARLRNHRVTESTEKSEEKNLTQRARRRRGRGDAEGAEKSGRRTKDEGRKTKDGETAGRAGGQMGR